MNSVEADRLLREGQIKEWNQRRISDPKIPSLRGSDLLRANLRGADLRKANLSKSDLSGANLSEANLSEANLSAADLRKANLRGADLRKANLRAADLSEADLSGANLGGADLRKANISALDLTGVSLSGLNLSGANLSGHDFSAANLSGLKLSASNLSGADLSGTNLRTANLSGADLRAAYLSEADLGEADLRKADLSGADLRGGDLSTANLSGANLSGADLSEADLRKADLRDTILFRARMIRCQLANAVFENADVTDCQVHETRGRPVPPSVLKVSDDSTLTGEDARSFFNPPATVEVYLSAILTDQEIGLYHFHLGEVQHRGVGTDVYLVGRRNEVDGTVLRFQAPTYEQIYQVLHVLLAPFRLSRAVDWAKTFQNFPEQERGQVLAELARIEAADPSGFWHFAGRLAEGIGNFPTAQVKQIRDGRHWAVQIDVATNKAMARKLTAQPKRSLPRPEQKNEFHFPGSNVHVSFSEDRSMSQEIKAGGNVVVAAGEGNVLSTGDVVFQQVWNDAGGSIDLLKLADDLSKLRAEMKKDATEPEHDVAIGNVSMAEKAAKEGNGPKALEYLKAAGKWALDIWKEIGVSVASDTLKKVIGLDRP